MARSIRDDGGQKPLETVVIPSPKPAKATLREDHARQEPAAVEEPADHEGPNRHGSLSGVVRSAARRVYGKQGAVAARLQKDEANFGRELRRGRLTLAQLESLGHSFLAEFGKDLVEQYGPAISPKERARRYVREIRQLVDELERLLLEEDVA